MSEIKNENRKRTGLKFGSQYPLAYAMASSATALLDLEVERTAPKETKTGLPRIKSFKEWFVEKSLSEIESILIEEGYEPTEEHMIALLEAGFMDKIKKYGRNAALASALVGAGMGIGSKMQTNNNIAPVPQQATQQATQQTNQQATQQVQKDALSNFRRGIKLQIDKRGDKTIYLYTTPVKDGKDLRKQEIQKILFGKKAVVLFQQDTGSDMKGVEWGVKTVKGHHGAYFIVAQ